MGEPRWLNDEEQRLWRLMLAATHRVSREIDDALQAESNLSSSEFSVLVTLSEAPERSMRLRDLCARLAWDRSRTSHLVTRMEKRGLVHKEPIQGDGRGVSIRLSDDGFSRLVAAAPEHVEVVRRLIFDPIAGVNMDVVEDFLKGIAGSAGTQ